MSIILHRLAKFIAYTGYCSRREAERFIENGEVVVDGKVTRDFSIRVSSQNDIYVKKHKIGPIPKPRLWIYHKPDGLVTTHSDPENRKTVFEQLPSEMPRVISVGRLDYNTEGLLLLTNSGSLATKLEHPKNGLMRRYKCRAFGSITASYIKQLAHGISISGVLYQSIKVDILKQQKSNVWLLIALYEGKNREIRKALGHFGLIVNRLIRIQYGKFFLNNIAKGSTIELHEEEFDEYLS